MKDGWKSVKTKKGGKKLRCQKTTKKIANAWTKDGEKQSKAQEAKRSTYPVGLYQTKFKRKVDFTNLDKLTQTTPGESGDW